ncbi:MAG: DNA repair protein RecO [Desulfuromonadales bacterium GWD2_54_10]|nr:MAG: DNA repair protein RecO [Desulfuromonadales bacterium GWD2_54_10]
MRTEKLQAFVLSTLDYGDSDRIVSLFTLEHGRIKAFARGAKKSRKRFGAALETFARIEAQVRVKDGLSGIQQAEIHSIYPRVRADLAGIAHALYACELVEVITPEGHPLPRLYRLLAAYLDRLETGPAVESDRRFFEINLLNILGYRPSLDSCSRCDIPFAESGALLQENNELICRACTTGGQALASASLRILLACLGTGKFGQIILPPEICAEVGSLLDNAVAAHADRRLKSLEFLRQVSR